MRIECLDEGPDSKTKDNFYRSNVSCLDAEFAEGQYWIENFSETAELLAHDSLATAQAWACESGKVFLFS